MRHIHIAIGTDDDEIARKAQLDAVAAIDAPVYRSWVEKVPNPAPKPGQVDELKDALPKPHADLGR